MVDPGSGEGEQVTRDFAVHVGFAGPVLGQAVGGWNLGLQWRVNSSKFQVVSSHWTDSELIVRLTKSENRDQSLEVTN